jgi:hypothetical protein
MAGSWLSWTITIVHCNDGTVERDHDVENPSALTAALLRKNYKADMFISQQGRIATTPPSTNLPHPSKLVAS